MTGNFQHEDTKARSDHALHVPSLLPDKMEVLAKQIVDAAFQVHSTMGPGLLEKIYEECFVCELMDRGIQFERQKTIVFTYKNHDIRLEYKIDLLIEGCIVVELKSLESVLPVHKAQILSYMRLIDARLGFLINFGAPLIKQGITRIVR